MFSNIHDLYGTLVFDTFTFLQFSKLTDNILNSRKFMLSEVYIYLESRL